MNKAVETQTGIEGIRKSGEDQSGVSSRPPPKDVRFWSTYSGYCVAVDGRNIRFKNHALAFSADDPDVKVLRGSKSPHIFEVADRPFESEKDLARFNKFLNDLVFTGERGEASKRGAIAVRALLRAEETEDMMVDGRFDTDRLIMRVLKSKSFKRGI